MEMSETRRGLAVREIIPLDRVRKIMAKSMKASVETLALSQVSRELDITRLASAREKQASTGRKISLNTLLMAGAARVLPAHAWLNAELVENEIVVYQAVNLGMAISTPAGLVVGVIRNANLLRLEELEEKAASLAARARSGTLTLDDIEGGTFTVSNLGMFGVDSGLALPRPPESAILLFGAARPRPVIQDGLVQAGVTLWACLTYDHRFIDGALGAAYLADVDRCLQEPEAIY